MYYIAYGSNLNVEQMAHRCPTARLLGTTGLKGYRLVFCGCATVEADVGASVPVGIWDIKAEDEQNLDRYEGAPRFYRKEYIAVEFQGRKIQALIYIMNTPRAQCYELPSPFYFQTIWNGYRELGLDVRYLKNAMEYTRKNIIK